MPGLSRAYHAKLRVEYEAGIYHLINRGNQREPTSEDNADRVLSTGLLPRANST